ncbi:MAG: lasso peptide biosynthesis B2 protein [Nitrospirales bacterium]
MIKKPLLALKITTLMILIRLGLRWLQLPKLLHFLHSSQCPDSENLLEFQRVVYYTDRILKAFPYNEKGNCLPRSLILYVLAPRYGYRVKFHCGVRKTETGLDGHAWLTVKGKPFWEPSRETVGMVETFSYPND